MVLHENEYAIDVELVKDLLADQAPQWSHLPIVRVETAGTVNVAFRIGDDKVVRLPRSSKLGDGPQREAIVLPRLGSKLPLDLPIHNLLGTPTEAYPGHWSVLGWIDGTTANSSNLGDLAHAASQLGEFVVALQQVSTAGAPKGGNYRAFGLASTDDGVRKWVDQLPADIDRRSVLGTWQSCLAAGEWHGPPKWLHGDLRGDNLIARNGALVGVIDWEACAVGTHLLTTWPPGGSSTPTAGNRSAASPTSKTLIGSEQRDGRSRWLSQPSRTTSTQTWNS